MANHGNLLVYGNTRSAAFPMILCVGREPNADQSIVNQVHAYDFDAPWGPKCKFWSESFFAVQQAADDTRNGADLKQKCREANASPIAYADALPIAVRMGKTSPDQKRREAADMAAEHVQSVFAHKDIMDRVEVILLSGLLPIYRGRWFQAAVDEYTRMAEGRVVTHVPFFFPTNRTAIAQAVNASPVAKDNIGKVVRSF